MAKRIEHVLTAHSLLAASRRLRNDDTAGAKIIHR